MSRRHHHTSRATGVEALENTYKAVDHEPLKQALGVELDDSILALALTHRSFANENGTLPNNERLEFLGDAVLGLSVAGALYEKFPSRTESDISKMRASIVSRYGCADIAREINLGDYILLGRGELATDGRQKESILADTVEALLGAIYREHGFEVARDTVLRLFGRKIATASTRNRNQDWKTILQERLADTKLDMPVYKADSAGPEHDLTFTARVFVRDVELGKGIGHNKKLAEQDAARQAWERLRDRATVVALGLGADA